MVRCCFACGLLSLVMPTNCLAQKSIEQEPAGCAEPLPGVLHIFIIADEDNQHSSSLPSSISPWSRTYRLVIDVDASDFVIFGVGIRSCEVGKYITSSKQGAS